MLLLEGIGIRNLFADAWCRHGELHTEATGWVAPERSVNEAYRLTPDEVRLMWATAPPRMPLTLRADAPDQAESEAVE